MNYYQLNASWGDFGTCYGWSGAYLDDRQAARRPDSAGLQMQVQISHAFYTTANGCGPGAGGGAGVTIDDMRLEGTPGPSPVESQSWGSIKAMYR